MKKTMTFDLSIYSPEALMRAMEAFSDAATFAVKREERYWEISLSGEAERGLLLDGEFDNCVIRFENRVGGDGL